MLGFGLENIPQVQVYRLSQTPRNRAVGRKTRRAQNVAAHPVKIAPLLSRFRGIGPGKVLETTEILPRILVAGYLHPTAQIRREQRRVAMARSGRAEIFALPLLPVGSGEKLGAPKMWLLTPLKSRRF
jgi:hypothetical protein